MKTIILTCCVMAAAFSSFAQKTEKSVFLNTGFSNFRGTHTTSTTSMSGYSSEKDKSSVYELYGSKPGLSYGAGVQMQRVTAYGFLYGAQIGAELLRSRIAIDQIRLTAAPMSGQQSVAVPATGKSVMLHPYINVNPYLGRRWQAAALDFDVMLGIDYGVLLSSRQKGEATTADGETYTTNWLPTVGSYHDFMPKAGITVYKNHFGVFASYAHGVTNYKPGIGDGRKPEAYRNVFRTGIHYRF